jgi:DNA polymerase-1
VPRPSFLNFDDDDSDRYIPDSPPELDRYDTIEFDTETDGLEWKRGDRPVGLCVGAGGQYWYLPIAHRGGGNLCEATVKRWAERELRGKYVRGAFLKFDLHVTEEWGVNLRNQDCRFHDVMHSEALLDDHEKRTNLEHITKKRLGPTRGKLNVGRPESIAYQHASMVAEYGKEDVRLVADLAAVYNPLLRAEGLERVSRLEDDTLPVVVEIEANGMPLDLELLERWDESSRELLERLKWDLYKDVGFAVNPNSPTDMTRLWKACGLPLEHFTAKGKGSFTADIVMAAAEHHPAIAKVWRIGKLDDIRTKYIVPYRESHVNGSIYAKINQLPTEKDGGTGTGRFSCSKPNLQAVLAKSKHKRQYAWLSEYGPEEYFIKKLFKAPEGHRWVSADMDQVQYRVAVHYANDSALLARYAEDPKTDFHEIVGQMIEQTTKRSRTRTEVKTANFLSIFGGGVNALARNLKTDPCTAQEIRDAHQMAFPALYELIDRASERARQVGSVHTWLGRKSRFLGERWNRERTHKACNSICQMSEADICKLTMVEAYKHRHEHQMTMRMVVHDSTEATTPIDGMEDRLTAYSNLLNEQRVPMNVPILWSVDHGPTWGDC